MKKPMLVLLTVIGMLMAMFSVSGAEDRYSLRGSIKSMDAGKKEIVYHVRRDDRTRSNLPHEITIVLREHDYWTMKRYFDNCKKEKPGMPVEAWVQLRLVDGKYVARYISPPIYGDD
ncbi:MAG: hypothetical protein HZA22_11020 [Nitrospirae bacterium]|nr:hypothetical protein [Nitrospirota bacterium]